MTEAPPSAASLQPHEQRVVVEKQELDDRAIKLSHFMVTSTYAALAQVDRVLLHQQREEMRALSITLGKRISRFYELRS